MSEQSIDRSTLPIRRPPYQGVVRRTLDGSKPDWNYVAPLLPPEGAPNVLLVLVDDAGFGGGGSAEYVRRPDRRARHGPASLRKASGITGST